MFTRTLRPKPSLGRLLTPGSPLSVRVSTHYVRHISTVKSSSDQEIEILNQQRKVRPVSPHLNIYKPQLTWVLSGLHRVTGVAMGGAFYALTCGFAATSLLGVPFEMNTVIAAFGALPVAVKIGAKAVMAFPFVFHSFNGVRHLVWDFGKEMTIKGVYRTGYVVLGLAAVLGSYLTFF